MRLHAQDHLLLVSMNDKLLAIDPLGTRDDTAPRIVWTRDLAAARSLSPYEQPPQLAWANLPAGVARVLAQRFSNQVLTLPQAVSEELVCIAQFRHLIAMDTATGETVWTRHDLKPGSTVFGNHQYVFVVPRDGTTATVLSARDGSSLGKREVPGRRLATLGHHVLTWRDEGGSQQLELLDPWSQTAVWTSREFSLDAQLSMGLTSGAMEPEIAAVLEPDGRFTLIDVASGHTVIDTQLDLPSPIERFSVLASGEVYLVLAHVDNTQGDLTRTAQPIGGVPSEVIQRARLFAFDRQGKERWPSPLVVEDQCLPHNQPKLLPVVTFVCTYKEAPATGRSQYDTSVLCIDKRTGRVLFEEDFDWRNNSYQVIGNPDEKKIQIQLQKATVTLTFTDQSWDVAQKAEEPPSVSSALFNALRNAATGTPRRSSSRSHVKHPGEEPEAPPPLDEVPDEDEPQE
jgi:hypothetical protein